MSTALEDQRLAAGIMWIAGDAVFLIAILAVVAGWMRAEARDTARADRRADIEMAEIRIREQRLAERLPGSGANAGSRGRVRPGPARTAPPSVSPRAERRVEVAAVARRGRRSRR